MKLPGGIYFHCEKLIRWFFYYLEIKQTNLFIILLFFLLTTSYNTYYKHDTNIVHLIFYHIKSCGK